MKYYQFIKNIDGVRYHKKISNTIKEHHDIDASDNIVNEYITLAESKIFTLDPIIEIIRESIHRMILNNKYDYVLDDGNIITVDEDTKTLLNTVLKDKYDIISYMRESQSNFLSVLKRLRNN